jgi:undecaprenyl-diphosphatase
MLLLLTALFITFSDQLVNLIKNHFMRLRPCSDPEINETIRIVLKRSSYSFVSGHSTTSFAITAYFVLLLKNHFKYIQFLVIWPILFAYSRVYIGVHFPLDILIGMYLGLIEGYIFFRLTLLFLRKFR